jgi:hypothetical protein
MRREYDFSQGARGKFFRKDGETRLPVYVDTDVIAFLKEHARAKGVDLHDLVNALLRQDMARLEAEK